MERPTHSNGIVTRCGCIINYKCLILRNNGQKNAIHSCHHM